MSTPDVQHQSDRSRFVVLFDDGSEAELTYSEMTDEVVAFTHTLVPEAHEGQGVGSSLVTAGLAWAEAEGRRVRPVCSYVAAYVRRHPEHADLIAPGGGV